MTRMMKDITGLTRSLLNLAKSRGKDRTRKYLGKDLPTKEPRGRITDHQRDGSPRKNCYKDFPGILGDDGVLEDQEVLVEGA